MDVDFGEKIVANIAVEEVQKMAEAMGLRAIGRVVEQ